MNTDDTPSNDSIEIRVFEVSQPLGTFYVGIMKANDLRQIAAADIRRQDLNSTQEIYTRN